MYKYTLEMWPNGFELHGNDGHDDGMTYHAKDGFGNNDNDGFGDHGKGGNLSRLKTS